MMIQAGIANTVLIIRRGTLNLFSHWAGFRRKSDFGMNSAVTMTTKVVTSVWTASAKIGEGAESQSLELKICWLIKAPDSIPQITSAILLPTNMTAMNSWGRLKKEEASCPLHPCFALSSICNRFAETKAISIPEKNAEAAKEARIIKIELEGSGSICLFD